MSLILSVNDSLQCHYNVCQLSLWTGLIQANTHCDPVSGLRKHSTKLAFMFHYLKELPFTAASIICQIHKFTVCHCYASFNTFLKPAAYKSFKLVYSTYSWLHSLLGTAMPLLIHLHRLVCSLNQDDKLFSLLFINYFITI